MFIKDMLRKIISKSKLCKKIAEVYDASQYGKRCYGQNAEDVIISSFFPPDYAGFYVDIGAHHPVRFSNTYLLYQAGWHGINIDPLPGSMLLFDKMRSRDVNLELCVSGSEDPVKYYSFDEPAYNTISAERAEEIIGKKYSQLKQTWEIKSEPLWSIFSRCIPERQSIDLMTVDVETMELQVLKTNDWKRYIPKIIVMESLISLEKDIFSVAEDPVVSFLQEHKYSVIGKAVNAVYLRYEN